MPPPRVYVDCVHFLCKYLKTCGRDVVGCLFSMSVNPSIAVCRISPPCDKNTPFFHGKHSALGQALQVAAKNDHWDIVRFLASRSPEAQEAASLLWVAAEYGHPGHTIAWGGMMDWCFGRPPPGEGEVIGWLGPSGWWSGYSKSLIFERVSQPAL